MEIGGMVFRARFPAGKGPHPVFLMLHGWTGDENSMWVFAGRLPAETIQLAPRGLFESPWGGYGWYPSLPQGWPRIDDFQPAIDQIEGLLKPEYFPSANLNSIRLVGFSQGAALAYSMAITYPERIKAVAGLSGFVPDGVEDIIDDLPLNDKQLFVSHGTRDQLVPVERARQSVELLKRAGAQVTYCERQAGHKLSADCFRSMQSFFQ